jgi:pimeloyl-ACP methyl ester carboxylesterase
MEENGGMHEPNLDPVASILDVPQVSGKYFFPQERSVDDPFVVEVPGARLNCFHRVVALDNLTLMHFHGNGEAVADYVPDMADELAELGLNSLFVEYRQYGGSTGQAYLVAMLGDGEAALAAAGLVPEKTLVLGRSMGSLYTIELVHRQPRIAGLIIESGIADAAERFLKYADLSTAGVTEAEIHAEAKRHFNHKQKLSGYKGPVLVLHTEKDGLVDISHAERNHRWAGGREKQLLRFPQGNHNTILARNREEYFQAIGCLVKAIGKER